MNQQITILQAITDFLFGHRYYTFAVRRIGTEEVFLTGEIFYSRDEQYHRRLANIENSTALRLIAPISFRSRSKVIEATQRDFHHDV